VAPFKNSRKLYSKKSWKYGGESIYRRNSPIHRPKVCACALARSLSLPPFVSLFPLLVLRPLNRSLLPCSPRTACARLIHFRVLRDFCESAGKVVNIEMKNGFAFVVGTAASMRSARSTTRRRRMRGRSWPPTTARCSPAQKLMLRSAAMHALP
jgi:hypothetical protein